MVKLAKFSLVSVVALLLMAPWAQRVFAPGSVDQSNQAKNLGHENREAAGFDTIAFTVPIGQELTPAQARLTGVDVYLTSVNRELGDGENITVNIGKGTINSAVIASASQFVPNFDEQGK